MKLMQSVSKEKKKELLSLGAICLTAVLISLMLTHFIPGIKWKMLPWVLCLIVPRLMTLFLFLIPSQLFPHRRTGTFVMTAVWILWIGIAYRCTVTALIPIFFFLVFAAQAYFTKEKANPEPSVLDVSRISRLSVLMMIAVLAVFVIEILQTKSLLLPMRSMIGSPDIFACNLLLFTALGSFLYWVPKQKSALIFHLVFWLTLVIISFFKSKNLYEPVVLNDVYQIRDGIPAAINFLGVVGIILVAIGIVCVIVGLVLVIKLEKSKPFSVKRMTACLIYAVVAIAAVLGASRLSTIKYKSDMKPKQAYNEKGFVYCFLTYGLDTVTFDPENYEEKLVNEIIQKIDNREPKPMVTPDPNAGSEVPAVREVKNLIVIQLESFVDPYWVHDVTYERDPMPFMRSLAENYTSGKIEVPTYGGSTIRSEFEFLSAMNFDFLIKGKGSYNPYTQDLCNHAIDTLPRYLRSIGYSATAIHDYQGEFFYRNRVYQNMGFETFIPYECMSGVEKRNGGSSIWANDAILLTQIQNVIENSETEKNFIFTASVQTHQPYATDLKPSEYPMAISGLEDETLCSKMAYFVGQLEEVDRTVKSIIDYFEKLDEPTYILFYADHMPEFYADLPGFTEEERYYTEFFTWNNLNLEKKEDKKLELYLLSNEVCADLNIEGSFMNLFHNMFRDDPDYLGLFEAIQTYKYYNEYKSDNVNLDNPDYKIGYMPLTITGIRPNSDGTYVISGTALTENTYLSVNGTNFKMTYVDENTMSLSGYPGTLSQLDTIKLIIVGEKYGAILKESEPFDWS